jgi:hypothetical protein
MSELLQLADFDDLPPSTVDLQAAVRTGRARERRRRVMAVTAVAVVVLVAATGVALAVDRRPAPRPIQPPAKEWHCTVTTVPSQRYLVDPTGDIVVSWSDRGPIRMQRGGGAPREITGLPGVDPYPVRVSSTGVVIGESSDGREADRVLGWMYRDGQVTTLPAPAEARRVQPWSVNIHGDAVGFSQRPGPNDAVVVINELVLWPAAAPGTFRLLTVPDGTDPMGSIRDDGTVLGTAIFPGTGNGGLDGVIWWPDGTVERMHHPGSNILGSTGDWVFGNFAAPDNLKGFRYNVRSHEYVDLDTFEPGLVLAGDRLVGRVLGPAGSTPAIWHDGTVEALPLPPSVKDVEVTTAGNRVIYGRSQSPADPSVLLWRC